MARAAGSMKQGYEALTEKEKQTLRLLLAGHDAKSLARHLGLSVHTINERLRDARRKLSAASSREAARLLRESEEENGAPYSFGDEPLGDAHAAAAGQQDGKSDAASPRRRRAAWAIGGFAMIALAIALLALSPSSQPAADTAAPAATASPQPATRAARQWLELVDAARWQESWAATAPSFQSQNTVAMWRSASESARVPLGRVLSRTSAGEESIPAPPKGYQLVRFRTDFANKARVVETLSLALEGGEWKVAGYYID